MESNVHQSMAHFGLPDLQPEDSSGDNTWILEYLKRLKKHEIQTFHQIWRVHSHSASLTHPRCTSIWPEQLQDALNCNS